MIGFSLAHSDLGPLLLLAVLGSLVWLVVVLIAVLITRSFGGKKIPLMFAAYSLGWALLFTPYGFWQRVFIDKFTSEQGIEFLTYAAAYGDIRTVRAFLQAGVPINAQAKSGTALHSAAVNGQLETMDYLISQGADINAINVFGNSPMSNALHAWERSAEAQALLEMHGAKLVEGTEEQRRQVIDQQAREDKERMQKDMP